MSDGLLDFTIATTLNSSTRDIDDVMIKLYSVLGMAEEHKVNDKTLRFSKQLHQAIDSLRLAQQIISDSDNNLDD